MLSLVNEQAAARSQCRARIQHGRVRWGGSFIQLLLAFFNWTTSILGGELSGIFLNGPDNKLAVESLRGCC